MKVAIYARVSTEEQTVDNQLLELRAYCNRCEHSVYGEYTDVMSGAKESRPELDRLMQDARLKHFDAVVVWKLDRLGRSLQHVVNIVNEWKNKGIDLICVTQSIDTTNPSGKFVFYVFAALAEIERDMIVERTKAGLKRARSEGKRIGRPPITPYQRRRILAVYSKVKSIRQVSIKVPSVSYGTCYKVIKERDEK